MAVERYGSKTDLVVKLILVFCVSMLSFAIGTLVGKKFSDNQHRISQLDPSTKEKGDGSEGTTVAEESPESSAQAAPEKAKESATVSDKEISKLAEEFVDDEKPTRKVAAVEGSDSEDKPTVDKAGQDSDSQATEGAKEEPKKAQATTGKEPSMKVSLKKAAASTAVSEKAASDLSKEVKASAAGKYTVQVASYAKEEEAEGMTADLKNKGFSAFYVTAQVKGQKWFRVSVGLFTTMKEAQAYRSDLLARAKVSSAIVQKIN